MMEIHIPLDGQDAALIEQVREIDAGQRPSNIMPPLPRVRLGLSYRNAIQFRDYLDGEIKRIDAVVAQQHRRADNARHWVAKIKPEDVQSTPVFVRPAENERRAEAGL